MTELEKFDLRSSDLTEEKKQELLRLFPEIRTEGGLIDFDRLKLVLGETIDVGKERYGMNWPGKADCFRTIQAPSTGTLLPCPEESWPPKPFLTQRRGERGELDLDSAASAPPRETNFNISENLIIEGDNLEVLKLLQKAYLGKVKMIYIDPPYNTGNDFIYPDNYTESLQTYLEYTGQVDSEGRKFGTNSDTDGRFHSRWMNMMYSRLYLARNLLTDDGLIFISIDDNEIANLRKLCNEIFGEENFIDNVIWKKRYGGGAKEKYLVSVHEYILVYTKDIESIGELFVPYSEETIERYYTLQDKNSPIRGAYRTHPLEATKSMGERKNLVFPITAPDGTQVMPKRQWLWGKERVEQAINKGELAFLHDRDGNWVIHTKQYLKDEEGNVRLSKAFSIIEDVYTQHGTNEIIDLFGDAQIFPFPKPKGLFKTLLDLGSDKNSIVLDFFAGSGAIAHAILEQNQLDKGNRKFILVQLPEPTGREDYPTIADITKERVRRVIQKLSREAAENAEKKKQPDLFSSANSAPPRAPDLGFRVFKLAESNFKPWNARLPQDAAALAQQLELHIEHIREGRSPADILYELLLKSGFPLTTPVETLTLAGKQVFSVAGGALLICLEPELTMEVIRALAAQKPERVVLLDAGFAGNDQLKANAVQIFKTQGIPSFKTV